MTTVKNMKDSVTTSSKLPTALEKGKNISPKLKKFIEEETRLVKGRFRNLETEGGPLPLTCGKYPGQPIFSAVFQDGEVYEVPLWVARHLNGIDVTAEGCNGFIGSCSYAIHGFKWAEGKPAPSSGLNSSGVPEPSTQIAKRKQRYAFESLEFGSF